ncbi:hypothetical protein HHA03_02950 [Halolactibacillus halophilus]|uniref:Uncharacterized protein n=1 Tax=Halolactibacillus halophilus TaxID=306540 RepID=A0ABQ0VHZ0_9BACI|nr:hypothetical protein HHA03_02950 [Halolactibacillus halophilus]
MHELNKNDMIDLHVKIAEKHFRFKEYKKGIAVILQKNTVSHPYNEKLKSDEI